MVEYLTLKKMVMNKAKKLILLIQNLSKIAILEKGSYFLMEKNLVDLENEKSKMFYKILIRKILQGITWKRWGKQNSIRPTIHQNGQTSIQEWSNHNLIYPGCSNTCFYV